MSIKTHSVLYSIDQSTKTFRSTARDLTKSGNSHWKEHTYFAGNIGSRFIDTNQADNRPYIVDVTEISKRDAEHYQWSKDAMLALLGFTKVVATLK